MELKLVGKYLGIFLFLFFLQIFLLDNIRISSLNITPFLYILFILLLPVEIPGWLLLILSFLIGLSVDTFEDTGGTHAAACVFTAFIRPMVFKILSPRDGYEPGMLPRVEYMGISWFLKYSSILVIFHHSLYYILEIFTFSHFGDTFLKIFFTGISSIFLIILSQFLIFRK